jgi:pyruvate,water dikinase
MHEWSGREFSLLIAERKARVLQLESLAAPDVIIDNTPSYVQPQPSKDGDTLHGVPVAAGIAQGNACVVHTPEQGVNMQSGNVLIAPSTDPAWTPLFLNAAALVMETGGYLSHGSIVAREYGIPAVVNIAGVFKSLNNGEQLTVNGNRGTVEKTL